MKNPKNSTWLLKFQILAFEILNNYENSKKLKT
jgi:hypothetical protein